jgi:hypothetical protein
LARHPCSQYAPTWEPKTYVGPNMPPWPLDAWMQAAALDRCFVIKHQTHGPAVKTTYKTSPSRDDVVLRLPKWMY